MDEAGWLIHERAETMNWNIEWQDADYMMQNLNLLVFKRKKLKLSDNS